MPRRLRWLVDSVCEFLDAILQLLIRIGAIIIILLALLFLGVLVHHGFTTTPTEQTQ